MRNSGVKDPWFWGYLSSSNRNERQLAYQLACLLAYSQGQRPETTQAKSALESAEFLRVSTESINYNLPTLFNDIGYPIPLRWKEVPLKTAFEEMKEEWHRQRKWHIMLQEELSGFSSTERLSMNMPLPPYDEEKITLCVAEIHDVRNQRSFLYWPIIQSRKIVSQLIGNNHQKILSSNFEREMPLCHPKSLPDLFIQQERKYYKEKLGRHLCSNTEFWADTIRGFLSSDSPVLAMKGKSAEEIVQSIKVENKQVHGYENHLLDVLNLFVCLKGEYFVCAGGCTIMTNMRLLMNWDNTWFNFPLNTLDKYEFNNGSLDFHWTIDGTKRTELFTGQFISPDIVSKAKRDFGRYLAAESSRPEMDDIKNELLKLSREEVEKKNFLKGCLDRIAYP